ncbi:uncharacterized protein LOC123684227 isoform X2 [Harmonia axyridis]|uniref:uncharacterized protein LOC123684227 isoform X2 n=1 Tax=Harmonia axyridis TaxID=115357 RepID=UPI001E2765C2|nr:uncharacterized protein LOC123684227 isoform X2 [Harmonia axyridis]
MSNLGMDLYCISDIIEQIVISSVILYVCDSARKENNRLLEIIQNIQVTIGRQNLPYKQMSLSLLNSKKNALNLSICGCIPFDWTLIFSVTATFTTYMVYLIQFKEMELQKNSSNGTVQT